MERKQDFVAVCWRKLLDFMQDDRKLELKGTCIAEICNCEATIVTEEKLVRKVGFVLGSLRSPLLPVPYQGLWATTGNCTGFA